MSISVYVGSLPPSAPPEMPIISRGQPATDSALTDSAYQTQESTGATSHEFAINLNAKSSAEKSNCVLIWWNQSRPVFNAVGPWYGTPSAYTIDKHTSSSGTKPTSGWANILTESSNTDSTRIHTGLDLSDAGWVRLNATATNGNGLALQIDIHDARAGQTDMIAFAGDSNCMQAWNGERLGGGAHNGGSMENLLEAATGRAAPVIFNGGVGGEIASSYHTAYAPFIRDLPVKYVHYNIGTNDCANAGSVINDAGLNTIRDKIMSTIAMWQAVGKVVLWGTIPWGNANASHTTNVVNLNAKMATAVAADATILAGADAYAVANGQHSLITDGLHFSYDPGTQAVTASHPMGFADGLTGYEALFREARDKLKTRIYGL